VSTPSPDHPTGPLVGVRVVELAGIGPAPHACMVLADLGADVVRVERRGATADLVPGAGESPDVLLRGRRVVHADLKSADDLAQVRDLVAGADVLVEGFRPGVAERLGLGPDECLEANPRLVYARMTGWGQDGPRAHTAGHDLNYLGLTGVLDNLGRAGEPPVPPLNLVGDFGGGSMFLVVGVLAALWEGQRTGRGQVVDAAIVDGVSALAQMQWSMRAAGLWRTGRGTNLLDGSAPFYDTYPCADGRHVAVAAIEPQFFAAMLAGLGLESGDIPGQWDRDQWPRLRERLAAAFASRTRDEWDAVYAGTDACVTPVLTWDEAEADPHLGARGVIAEAGGIPQAAPAPRFSAGAAPVPPTAREVSLGEVLEEWRDRSE
jgi:alpha-methylacyl-CoA racemase